MCRPTGLRQSTTIAAAVVMCLTLSQTAFFGESSDTDDAVSGGVSGSAVPPDWLSEVQHEIEEAEYRVTLKNHARLTGPDGAWHAPNRAHGFRTFFTTKGPRVVPRVESERSWEWGLTLVGYGRGRRVLPVETPEVEPDEKRVHYERRGVAEWYVNDRRGLEQGFTLYAPPEATDVPPDRAVRVPGARRGASSEETADPAFVVLKLSGSLSPRISADGQAIDFARSTGMVEVHYANLHVNDASGRELNSWMEAFAEAGMRGIRLVFDDEDATYPVTIDPMATAPAWSAGHDHSSANFGFSVASAGDVNGDGYSDVIVGAHGYDGGESREGSVFVYYGSASGLETTPAWTAEGDQREAQFGYSVASAGSVNCDGYSDVIVGAPGYETSSPSLGIDDGEAFVYYGSAQGLDPDGTRPSGSPANADWSDGGYYNYSDQRFGHSVSSAGDVNNDGCSDVIVGAPHWPSDPNVIRSVSIYRGSDTGLVRWQGIQRGPSGPATGFGNSVAGAGDVNGDGYDDVIVAEPLWDDGTLYEGRVTVYYGPNPPFSGSWSAQGNQEYALFGWSVASAGNVNGDPYDDIVVGAPGWGIEDPGEGGDSGDGAAFVYHGSGSGLSREWAAINVQPNTRFGESVAGAGDVDCDGFDDVIVGAPEADASSRTDSGQVYLYSGSLGGLNGEFLGWSWTEEGSQTGAQLGQSVASAGDVNNDGCDDIVVGAARFGLPGISSGGAFVYHGAPATTTSDLEEALGPVSDHVVWNSFYSRTTSGGANKTAPDTVYFGSIPESLLVTTGRVVGDRIVDVDWRQDGLPDETYLHFELNVPSWARTLRFTTQFLTNETGVDPDTFDTDTAEFRFRMNGWSAWSEWRRLDDPAVWLVSPPISHGINLVGSWTVELEFRVAEVDTTHDSGLLLSRVFFSEFPLPADITVADDGYDADGDGQVDYFANPAPHDVSLTSGSFTYTKNLLDVPGVSLPFRLAVVYNSESNEAASVGRKWSHSYIGYARKLRTDSDNDGTHELTVVVRHGAGTAEYFVRDDGPPVSYRPKFPGIYSTLTESPVGYTLTTKSHLTYEFSEQDDKDDDVLLLTAVTDANGNRFSLTYGLKGGREVVTQVAGTGSETIDFDYDTEGRVTTVSYDWQTAGQPPESVTSFVTLAYDTASNDLVSIADLAGRLTTFLYDDFGHLLTVTDPDGMVSSANTYEQYQGLNLLQVGNRIVSQRDAGDADPFDPETGLAFEYLRESLIRTDRLAVPRGETRLYDVKGRLVRRVDSRGVRHDFSHDRNGNVIESRRQIPTESVTRTTTESRYDHRGNLLSRVTFPGICIGGPRMGDGCEIDGNCPESSCGAGGSMSYDAEDNLTSTTDHAGNTATFRYDTDHNLLAAVDALGNTVSNTYTSAGQPASTTDARGNVYSCEYEAPLVRPTRVYNPVDAEDDGVLDHVTYTYDALGRRTSMTDPNGNTTNFEYDAAGRLVSQTDATGNSPTRYSYDTAGRLLTTELPSGGLQATAYTVTGEIASITDAAGNTTAYEYDEAERLVALTDPLDRVTRFEYDAADRLTRVRVCGAGQGADCATPVAEVSAEYDEAGNLVRIVNPNGHATTYEHDLLGRVIGETDPLGHTLGFAYDGRGQLATKTNGRGQTLAFEYDEAGRLVGVQLPEGSITHTLDPSGNALLSESDAFASVGRTFDAMDRLVERVDEYGNVVSYRYDPAGNLVELIYPTDADQDGSRDSVTYGYDELNRLETVTDWNDRTTVYSYDADGNLLQASLPDGSTVSYTHDPIGRLTGVADTHPGAGTIFSASYQLDRVGRRLEASGVTLPVVPSLVVGADDFTHDALNQLQSFGPENFAYDADGNMTLGVIDGVPLNLSYNALNQLVSLDADTIRYDVDGLRVETRFYGVPRRYVHDPSTGLSRLLEEHDENGALIARYVHGLGLIAREDGSGGLSVYHFDSRGSTVALTDATGLLTDAYAYDPYGRISGNWGSTPNPFTYNGRDGVYDDGNGLYYMRSRYYAPELMRFVQKDQAFEGFLTDTQSINRHAFVQGNPIVRVDPTGEYVLVDDLAALVIGAAIGAGSQLIECKISGQGCSWEDFAGAAAGGALGAWATLYLGPMAGGAIGSGSDELFTQLFKGEDVDWEQVGTQAAIGAAFGGLSYGASLKKAKGAAPGVNVLNLRGVVTTLGKTSAKKIIKKQLVEQLVGQVIGGGARGLFLGFGNRTTTVVTQSPDIWNQIADPRRDAWEGTPSDGCASYAWR